MFLKTYWPLTPIGSFFTLPRTWWPVWWLLTIIFGNYQRFWPFFTLFEDSLKIKQVSFNLAPLKAPRWMLVTSNNFNIFFLEPTLSTFSAKGQAKTKKKSCGILKTASLNLFQCSLKPSRFLSRCNICFFDLIRR